MIPRSLVIAAGALVAVAGVARASLPVGRPDAWWRTDVSAAPVDAQSAEIIAWLEQQGGFGFGRVQVDFSLEVLEADAATPFVPFVRTGDWYEPDCDFAPVPLPADGAIEGESGYACESDGDCHLIVWNPIAQVLHEMWRANLDGDTLYGGCLAAWDLTAPWGEFGRGQGCSSADASGFPIAPLLFDADEVAAGEIAHAIRFALPNARIRNRSYVFPASHATDAASGGAAAIPYGARLRLRGDFPLESLPNDGARVVARALQKYGMLLADGGNVALMGRSDRFTTAKWDGLLGSRDFDALQMTDFAMIEAGTRYYWNGDCIRAPEPAPALTALTAVVALAALALRQLRARPQVDG